MCQCAGDYEMLSTCLLGSACEIQVNYNISDIFDQ